MQANIYIYKQAMATVSAIKHLDYYDQVSVSDDFSADLTYHPGYYLNKNALCLVELPKDARPALFPSPADASRYGQHVRIPSQPTRLYLFRRT